MLTNQVTDRQTTTCDLRAKVLFRVSNVCVKTESDTSEVFAQVTLLPGPQQKSGVVFNTMERPMGLLLECRYILIDKLFEAQKGLTH